MPSPPQPKPDTATSSSAGGFLPVVLAACWIAATAALVEPLQAALPNWDELTIDAASLLGRLALPALAAAALLVPIALVTRWAFGARATALWTASCVALWIQADLLVWDYGTFDGSPLDWSVHAAKGWLEVAVAIGLLAFAIWKAEWVARRSLAILGLVSLLQLAGLAGMIQHNAPYAAKQVPAPAPPGATADFATFSTRGNAIVVVLDAMQSDVFAGAMQSPELAAAMPEGFVYYRNAISLYMSTKFSLQSMLTSRSIPSRVDALNWRAAAMRRSLPTLLGRRGFDARLATFSPRALACDRSIPGLSCTSLAEFGEPDPAKAFEADSRAEASLLLQLGAFRLAPHLLKSQIYDEGIWSIPEIYPRRESVRIDAKLPPATRADLAALDFWTSNLRVDDGAPRFRFLHLNSVHFPARAAADCRASSQRRLRLRQVETAQCMLSELFRFLRALDAAGAYDATQILVVADHGSHQLKGVDMRVADPPLEPDAIGGKGAVQNWWRAVPLFLAKQPGARGAMQVSDHPVSLCDIPATVLDGMGIDAPGAFECESIRSSGRRRPRLHYSYHETPRQKRLPRAQRYRYNFRPIRVDAHSWYEASWRWCPLGCADAVGDPGDPDDGSLPSD